MNLLENQQLSRSGRSGQRSRRLFGPTAECFARAELSTRARDILTEQQKQAARGRLRESTGRD